MIGMFLVLSALEWETRDNIILKRKSTVINGGLRDLGDLQCIINSVIG